MREKYQNQLDELQSQLKTMYALSHDCLRYGVSFKLAEQKLSSIQLMVERLHSLEKDVFHSCEMLILKQQPVAGDLELISRSIKQILDLRRVGEISLNCAKIIAQVPKECVLELLEQMSNLLLEMFECLQSANTARVEEIENLMDVCFKQMKDEIAKKLQDSQQEAHWWLEVLMLSKYFEKVGDHISAIAYT